MQGREEEEDLVLTEAQLILPQRGRNSLGSRRREVLW